MSEPSGNFPISVAPEHEQRETQFQFASATEASIKHPNCNEDCLLELPDKGVFAVLDGLGGYSKGDIASTTARDAIDAFFVAHQDQLIDESVLKGALEAGHNAILKMNPGDPESTHMATTATIIHIQRIGNDEYDISIAYVGDSPAYVIEADGQAQEMIYTKWHQQSVSEEYLKAELLRTPLDQRSQLSYFASKYYLNRNIMPYALGKNIVFDISTGKVRAKVGARFLLASDGITDNLLLRKIVEVVNSSDNPNTAAHNLMTEAKTASQENNCLAKPDDLTAIIIQL